MKLTNNDFKKILQYYNLGEFISFRKIRNGYANINYKVETAKGYFIFKIFMGKTLQDIQYEIDVLKELKKNRFPTAFPVERTDGQFISETKFGNIVIYNFIVGNQPEINEKAVSEIAGVVAKLNRLKSWTKFKKRNATNIDLCWNIINKFEISKNNYPKIFEYFKEETEFLSKPLKVKIPRGLIHGDVFPDNTLFIGNNFVSILDFEEVCTDNLLFDIGVSINGFCFQNNKFNPYLFKIFMDKYQEIRTITSKERKMLPYYMQWGAHAMICWHLNYILNNAEKKKLERINYFIDRVKKLRTMQLELEGFY